jgi:hypothetical protein
VQGLLTDYFQTETFMKQPTVERDRRPDKLDFLAAIEEAPAQMIGHFKLKEKVSECGCSLVHVAEQMEPVRLRVALQVNKLGMDTKMVDAQFEAEGQALAPMELSTSRR